VGELDELNARPWFARYAFAPAEIAQAGTLCQDRRREYLAGRFAAKEAVLKVLGIGLFRSVRPADISVLRAESGEPRIVLTGPARDAGRAIGLAGVTVSIAHKGIAVAAIACGWVNAAAPAAGYASGGQEGAS
jgi:holo-[acyl-carrier protein] synthase